MTEASGLRVRVVATNCSYMSKLVGLIVLMCLFHAVWGHDVCEEIPKVDLDPSIEVVLDLPGSSRTVCSDTFAVDYPDETVHRILSDVAKMEDFRVVIPSELKSARSSVRLQNASWRDVFDVLLEPLGYAWIEREHGVVVMREEVYDALPPVELKWRFIYITPDEFLSYSGLKDREAVSYAVDGKQIVITCHHRDSESINDILEHADTPNRVPHDPKVYWPAQLPRMAAKGGDPGLRLFHSDWVDPDLLVQKLKPLLNEDVGELIARDRPWGSIVITASPQRAEELHMLCEYLDQRKWYDPGTRNELDEE